MSLFLGFIFCAAAIAVLVMAGISPSILFDWKALLFVVAGIIGVSFITSSSGSFFKKIGWAAKTMRRPKDPSSLIAKILKLVQVARRDGVLKLESEEEAVSDTYIKKGLVLITTSAERDTIESILRSDSDYEGSMEKSAQDFIERIAVLSPGIGMLGTLVEIVQMLYTYKGPSTLAPGIANALLPVLYSGAIAYLFLMPIVSRVKSGAEKHKLYRELSIEGVLAIQAGEPPYIVRQRLSRYVEKKSNDDSINEDKEES